MADPLVSILVTTYNRSRVLRRAIECVLAQDFHDYELVIIDDCSTDDTQDVIRSFSDPRIRNIRNEVNVGSKLGDRAHKRRFVYELMRGKYFVNFCDDDYWLNSNLLSRQVSCFERYDNLAMVIGGQLTFMLDATSDMPPLTSRNLSEFVDPQDYSSRDPRVMFLRPSFDDGFMTSDRFLELFAKKPLDCNINGGAALMSRAHYVGAKALATNVGSQWQAGFEYFLGPGCYGDVVYFDSPELIVEARPQNASFQWTQLAHYRDSILSVEIAYRAPLADPALGRRCSRLRALRNETVRNVSLGFLGNTISIRRNDALGICSPENIREPVMPRHVLPVFLANGILPRAWDVTRMLAALPGWHETWRTSVFGRAYRAVRGADGESVAARRKNLRRYIRERVPEPVATKLRAIRGVWRGY